jgi:glutathione peroxidase-family protein
LALYAKRVSLLDTPGWKQFRQLVKNSKTLARMANQAKLHNFWNQPVYKFGYQVPRNHREAVEIDERNGNTKFQDVEKEEIAALNSKDCFKNLGKDTKTPAGYKKIPCHFVYDMKLDGQHKARFVAGRHPTDTPIGSVYSGVVSLEGIRIVTLIAEMNDMELWATNVGNTYLESYTKERVCFIAGPEFGVLEGSLVIIVKALYGLKSFEKKVA